MDNARFAMRPASPVNLDHMATVTIARARVCVKEWSDLLICRPKVQTSFVLCGHFYSWPRISTRLSMLALVTTVIELEAMAISARAGCKSPSIAKGIMSRL